MFLTPFSNKQVSPYMVMTAAMNAPIYRMYFCEGRGWGRHRGGEGRDCSGGGCWAILHQMLGKGDSK